jgi:phenylalanine-4-hydroxylase
MPARDFDELFFNVKPNAVGGIKIFTRDMPYRIEQHYEKLTAAENNIWARLFERLIDPLERYASKEYVQGLRELDLPSDRFPRFAALSAQIERKTGWKLAPVAGFLDEWVFFTLMSNAEFPVTDIIRRSQRFYEKYQGVKIQNEEGYTPEPDIFHDVRGHVPFLMDQAYGDALVEIGKTGVEILQNARGFSPELVTHNLRRLQNFTWWTYEFGVLIKQPNDAYRRLPNDMDHEIYGAGILSSYDEVMNVVACSHGKSQLSRLISFDFEEVVMTRFDYSAIQDRYFVIESMAKLYQDFLENRRMFFFAG